MKDLSTSTVDGARAFAEGSSLVHDRDDFDDYYEEIPPSERVYDCNDCEQGEHACFECPGMDT